jgi:hypothetical protein
MCPAPDKNLFYFSGLLNISYDNWNKAYDMDLRNFLHRVSLHTISYFIFVNLNYREQLLRIQELSGHWLPILVRTPRSS